MKTAIELAFEIELEKVRDTKRQHSNLAEMQKFINKCAAGLTDFPLVPRPNLVEDGSTAMRIGDSIPIRLPARTAATASVTYKTKESPMAKKFSLVVHSADNGYVVQDDFRAGEYSNGKTYVASSEKELGELMQKLAKEFRQPDPCAACKDKK